MATSRQFTAETKTQHSLRQLFYAAAAMSLAVIDRVDAQGNRTSKGQDFSQNLLKEFLVPASRQPCGV